MARMRWVPLLLLASAAFGGSVDSKTQKKMEAFGVKWWNARPPHKFVQWAPGRRAALLKEAAAFGGIPEGSFAQVRAALWKSVKKYGPKGKGSGKVFLEGHGYKSKFTRDKMWARIKGAGGKNQGLVMSLHGGGEGAGSSDSSWGWKGCMTIAPQGLLIHGDNWNRVHGEKTDPERSSRSPRRSSTSTPTASTAAASRWAGRARGTWPGASRTCWPARPPAHGVVMAMPKSQIRNKEDIDAIQYGLVPNVRNLAVYYFTGTEDKNCMPGTFLFVNDLIKELREEDRGGYEKVRFKLWPGVAHSYPPGEPGRCIEYLSQQRRDPYPKKIVWVYAANPHPQPDAKDRVGRYQQTTFY